MRSIIEGSLKNFAKFTGKHLCQSFLFNKVVGREYLGALKKKIVIIAIHAFFYKLHFCKQRQAKIGKKSSKC